MAWLVDNVRRCKDLWVLGAMVLFILAVTAATAAIAVGIPLLVLSEILGWEDRLFETWMAITAAVWLPAACGYAADKGFRTLPRLPLNKGVQPPSHVPGR